MNKEIKNAKMEFMKKRIQHKMENSKTLWEGVKSFLGWKGGGSPDIVVDNGVKVSMPGKIANVIQGTFKTKLESVEKSLGRPSGNYLKTVRNLTRGRSHMFSFVPVTREQIL